MNSNLSCTHPKLTIFGSVEDFAVLQFIRLLAYVHRQVTSIESSLEKHLVKLVPHILATGNGGFQL